MKGKKRSILRLLIERYENSVLSTTGSDRNLRIVSRLEKDFPEYCDYEKFDLAQSMNDDIRGWEEKGWITSLYDDEKERYTVIRLNVDAVDEICEALLKNGFHVEKVPLYTDTLELRSLRLLSEEKRQQVIENWRSTSSLVVTV